MAVEALDWDDLMASLESGQVIPIVGQDLLTVERAGCCTSAYHLLAQELMKDFAVPPEQVPQDCTLSQALRHHLHFRDIRGRIYTRTKVAFDRLNAPIPEPLRLLARIPAFRLFITTTFDSWMEKALNEERFQGAPQTIPIAYCPEDAPDLTPAQLQSGRPIVFQMFGRVSGRPCYAVSEEDMLEYLHAFQAKPPRLLCDELQRSHLLFIGNGLPDWLARFFIRTARGKRIIDNRNMSEFVVENQQRPDNQLVSFFNQFSSETNFFPDTSPVDFVRELHARWQDRHPDSAPPAGGEAAPVRTEAAGLPPRFIFISYTRADAAAVQRLRDALDAAGLDTWVDLQRLEIGDDYDRKIQNNIRNCSLFMPVMSANTEARTEGYFRKEWHWALNRLPDFTGSDRPFLVPIRLDDLRIEKALVPDSFKAAHTAFAPQGAPPDSLVASLRQIMRDLAKRERISV